MRADISAPACGVRRVVFAAERSVVGKIIIIFGLVAWRCNKGRGGRGDV